MRAVEAMIAWTPKGSNFGGTAGKVIVVPHPDYGDRAHDYMRTAGACWGYWRDLSSDQRLARMLLEFNTIVVRDGIAPAVAHAAFLEIDEYAEGIVRSLDGAREVEPWLVGITHDRGELDLVVDLKAVPTVEKCIAEILDMARPELGARDKVLSLLAKSLAMEIAAERPVHLNVQALYWALSAEGLLEIDKVEARWESIRDALRNA